MINDFSAGKNPIRNRKNRINSVKNGFSEIFKIFIHHEGKQSLHRINEDHEGREFFSLNIDGLGGLWGWALRFWI